MRRLVAPTVIGLTFMPACTDDPPTPPTTTVTFVLDTVPPITPPASMPAPAEALITAGDLPMTYAFRPNVDPRTRLAPADCADSAAGLTTAAGDDIVLPDGTLVAQSVSVGDPFVVDGVVARLDGGCVAAAARRVVETQIAAVPGTPREVELGEPAVSRLRVPPPVESIAAYEATVPVAIDGLDTVTYVDVVTIRDGDALAILTARRPSSAPTMTDLAVVVSAAVARLRARPSAV